MKPVRREHDLSAGCTTRKVLAVKVSAAAVKEIDIFVNQPLGMRGSYGLILAGASHVIDFDTERRRFRCNGLDAFQRCSDSHRARLILEFWCLAKPIVKIVMTGQSVVQLGSGVGTAVGVAVAGVGTGPATTGVVKPRKTAKETSVQSKFIDRASFLLRPSIVVGTIRYVPYGPVLLTHTLEQTARRLRLH